MNNRPPERGAVKRPDAGARVAKRLEEVFDPDRLSGLWVPAPAERPRAPGEAPPPPPLLVLLQRTRTAVRARYGASRAAAASSLFERLDEALAPQLPSKDGAEPDPKAVEESRAGAEPILDELEDLIDAFDVAVNVAGETRGAAASKELRAEAKAGGLAEAGKAKPEGAPGKGKEADGELGEAALGLAAGAAAIAESGAAEGMSGEGLGEELADDLEVDDLLENAEEATEALDGEDGA